MNAAQFSHTNFSDSMWQRLNWQQLINWWQGIRAYSDMSPDLKMRRQVQRSLRHRDAYCLHDWHRKFWEPLGIHPEVTTFAYQQLAKQSGLDIARIRPSDRLIEDLQFPLICWFDWEWQLSDALNQQFLRPRPKASLNTPHPHSAGDSASNQPQGSNHPDPCGNDLANDVGEDDWANALSYLDSSAWETIQDLIVTLEQEFLRLNKY
jgi:hypothetical protein